MTASPWLAGNWLRAVGRIIRRGPTEYTTAWADRRALYNLNQSYYDNAVYTPTAEGGQREYINATLGNAEAADLAGLYNPVESVVNLYQHVFGGQFGVDIVPVVEDEALQDALLMIWKWSNINVEKQQLCRLPSLHGCCGLRIVAKDSDDPDRRRVYL